MPNTEDNQELAAIPTTPAMHEHVSHSSRRSPPSPLVPAPFLFGSVSHPLIQPDGFFFSHRASCDRHDLYETHSVGVSHFLEGGSVNISRSWLMLRMPLDVPRRLVSILN